MGIFKKLRIKRDVNEYLTAAELRFIHNSYLTHLNNTARVKLDDVGKRYKLTEALKTK